MTAPKSLIIDGPYDPSSQYMERVRNVMLSIFSKCAIFGFMVDVAIHPAKIFFFCEELQG